MAERILKRTLCLILILASGISSFAGSEAPRRIFYGKDPSQFGELRLPVGKGPFPVLILIHGGCWLSDYDLSYLNPLADWFTKEGFATWNIEYRRIGNSGGAWPGTFIDVGQAADALRVISRNTPLDLDKVYAVGHSAGGQLALWLAGRRKMTADSPLFLAGALPVQGVLGLEAITDLEKYRVGTPGSCHSAVDLLLGGNPRSVPRRYRETSPLQRLPLGVTQIFIQGGEDTIVEPSSVEAYVAAATSAGDRAVMLNLPKAGHFEAVTPNVRCTPTLRKALELLQVSNNRK